MNGTSVYVSSVLVDVAVDSDFLPYNKHIILCAVSVLYLGGARETC